MPLRRFELQFFGTNLLISNALLLIAVIIVALLPSRTSNPLLIAIAICGFLQIIAVKVIPARARRTLLKHAFRICPRCRYILTGLPDTGSCPECGNPYTYSEIRTKWIDRFSLYDAAAPSETPPPAETSN